MDLGIANQVVIYTGAAGYIGRAACLRLAMEGASLCLIDPAVDRLRSLCDEIRGKCPTARLLPIDDADVLDPAAVDAVLDRVENELGPVTCLVNSAYPRTKDWHLRFEDIPFESLRVNVDTHLNGYVLLCQRVSVRMMKQKRGNIVNFGSIYGLVGPDFSVYEGLDGMTMPAAYSVIKGAIVNFTRYLAAYLGPHGIRVNAICPGGVRDNQAPAFIEAYERKVPMKRMATVEDVIGPLVFLISDLSSYVSGTSLPVDGGWTAI